MKEKHITIIMFILLVILLVAVAIFITSAVSSEETGVNAPYKSAYFNPDYVNTISISIDDDDLQDMLEHPLAEAYHICSIAINGDTYNGTAIRTKGESSLKIVTLLGYIRQSFKIKADKYINGQSFKGLKSFALNNMYRDPTCMKDFLMYELMEELGVPTPLHTYAAVYINGEYFGLYLMLESVDKDFAARNFGGNYGQLYKSREANNNGSSLEYIDNNPSSYRALFDDPIYLTASSAASKERVIKAIKNLNQGSELSTYFDIEEVLKFIAALDATVSLDSYIGKLCHNYFLYEDKGQLQILPWDYNNAFGHFGIDDSLTILNYPIDTPIYSEIEISSRPLVSKLLEVDEYKQLYHTYLQEIAENFFGSSFNARVDSIEAMIGDYVRTDPTAFYSYDEHLKSLKNLKLFGELREKSILGQLNGTIPSTWDGQRLFTSKLIDASAIDNDFF